MKRKAAKQLSISIALAGAILELNGGKEFIENIQYELKDKKRRIERLNKELAQEQQLTQSLYDEIYHLKWLNDYYQNSPKSYGGPAMG